MKELILYKKSQYGENHAHIRVNQDTFNILNPTNV
jgi:hypothetical protein